MKGSVIRGHGAPGEPKGCPEELAAWVGHGLLHAKLADRLTPA
jgi:hypothetical protein